MPRSFATLDRRNFAESLPIRGGDVQRFISGDSGTSGFVSGLITAPRQALKSLSLALGQSGAFVDVFA